MILILKTGPKEDTCLYSPISLSSSVKKVFAKILLDKLNIEKKTQRNRLATVFIIEKCNTLITTKDIKTKIANV